MSRTSLTLSAVNGLDPEAFVEAFGDIAEHSPWVAERAAVWRPFADRAAMIEAFVNVVEAAEQQEQRALLTAHPDLAGKAAMIGDLTEDSAREQAGAGLDTLSPEEFEQFTRMNDRYRRKFGIPFIFAVRGATKHDILAAYEARLGGDLEEEFRTALAQVGRIIRFRLEDRVEL